VPILVKEQRVALLFVVSILAVGAAVPALKRTGFGRGLFEIPTEPETVKESVPPAVIDVNTAGAAELCRLPGVGPKIAERIIRSREVAGPFRTPEDLLDVPGIGPAKLAKMRSLVRTGGTTNDERQSDER
jgi:competence ComEA-like helix-hairpin-helix protein